MNVHSITIWLEQVKQGNDEAARRLWERYFPDLVKLAGGRSPGLRAAWKTRKTLR